MVRRRRHRNGTFKRYCYTDYFCQNRWASCRRNM